MATTRRSLPVVAPFRLGVFTAAEASACGWTRSALAAAVRRGALVHLRRGCWAPSTDILDPGAAATLRGRAAVAASLAAPGIGVSHLAAATAWGLPTWPARAGACVTETGRRRADLDGVHRHRAGGIGLVRVGGVLLTEPARTVFDVAREFGPEAGLICADAALRAGLVDSPALFGAGLASRGWPGARTARLVATLANPLAESPLESRSRWQIRRFDLPDPCPQVEIHTLRGEFVARVDLFWPGGVVGEVDGTVKYTRREVLVDEKWRQERLERCGLHVVRWGAQDLHDFGATAEILRTRLLRARAGHNPPAFVARHLERTYLPPAW